MSEVNETQAAVPSNLDLKAAPTPNTGVPATNPLASTQPTPALVVRASSTVRNVQPPQKSDSPARTPSTPLLPPDHRDANKSKDTPKPEEVSEYVSHGIDPSAPIYEITHAIPDSLILKCADCQRFARGTPHTLLFHTFVSHLPSNHAYLRPNKFVPHSSPSSSPPPYH